MLAVRDPESLLERLTALRAKARDLEAQRRSFSAEIAESEALSQQLQAKALECARTRDVNDAIRADQAKTFVAKLLDNASGVKPRSNGNGVALSGVQRSERKLELTLQVQALEHAMRSVSREEVEWRDRALHAEEQQHRAARRLEAVPASYTEGVAEVRKRIVSVLSGRRDVELAVTRLEGEKCSKVDALKAELKTLRRTALERAEELTETRRAAENWTQLVKVEQSRCEPSREWLQRVQSEIIDRGGGPCALSRVAIEGLANDGDSTIPVALAGTAIRRYLAPEAQASDGEIQKATEGFGEVLDAESLHTIAERLGLFTQ